MDSKRITSGGPVLADLLTPAPRPRYLISLNAFNYAVIIIIMTTITTAAAAVATRLHRVGARNGDFDLESSIDRLAGERVTMI